jgi:3-deoxy-D-manno-octulosonic-acid transferase
MLRAAVPSLLTVIAPRHPERGGDVAALACARGDTVARRSAGDAIADTTHIYVADTIGELGLFYTLADAAFVGGSLVEHGGQNPIEAIKLGAAILSGPHTFNFTETYETLGRFEGFRLVHNADGIAAAARKIFEDAEASAHMKRNASAAIATLGGALEKTLEALAPWLPASAPGEAAPQPELLPHDAP